MGLPARLLAVATAVPPYRLSQDDTRTYARRVFAHRVRDFDRLSPVFTNAGIEARHSCVPIDWYLEPHGWREKNAIYLDSAVAVLERAASECLRRAGIGIAEVGAIVAVSSTGVATPSLDALLIERMGFDPATRRLPIFGLGCVGGAIGLGHAATLAQAMPGRAVLFLVVELCALSFRHGDLSKSNIVATALFGDGAAAAVVRAGPGDRDAPELVAWGEHTWRNSLDVMGWDVEDDGLGVVFAQRIPDLVRSDFRAAADRFLSRNGLTAADLAGVVCHPGGAKVLDALAEVMAPATDGIADARAVLRDFGNMSAATVLFVLDRRLGQGARGRHLLSALGPGFTAGFVLMDL